MRAKTIAAFLAATAIVGAFAAPAGAAKPHRSKQKPSVSVELHLRGTDGFRLDLFTFGPHAVILSASKQTSQAGDEDVNYTLLSRHPRGAFGPDKLNVRIGPLGHFRGRFVRTSIETKKLDPGCEGTPATLEKGYLVGSFDFHGERGYTAVRSHRARGVVTRQAARICTFQDEPESPRETKEQAESEPDNLYLVASTRQANVLLQARREEAPRGSGPPLTTFFASVNGGKVGNFQVSHSASIFDVQADAATAFQAPNLAEPTTEATVAPPAPFSGSAAFHLEGPETASWTGDLAVEIPGLGKVPLTGEGIAAGLCKGPSCTKTLPKDLQPVLEAPSGVIVAVSASKPKRVR